MTDDDHDEERSRIGGNGRSILQTGALASVGLGVGSAAAQEGPGGTFGDDDGVGEPGWFQEDEAMKAVMFRDGWKPNGLFTVASPVLQFQPETPPVQDNVWSDYNSRAIRYMGTNESVLFFPADDAALGPFDEGFGYVVDDDFVENDRIVVDGQPVGGELDDQELSQLRPTIFIMDREFNWLGADNYVVTVNFSPIPEEEEQRVWNEFRGDFGIGTGSGGGATGTGTPTGAPTGTETGTPGGANDTDTPSG